MLYSWNSHISHCNCTETEQEMSNSTAIPLQNEHPLQYIAGLIPSPHVVHAFLACMTVLLMMDIVIFLLLRTLTSTAQQNKRSWLDTIESLGRMCRTIPWRMAVGHVLMLGWVILWIFTWAKLLAEVWDVFQNMTTL